MDGSHEKMLRSMCQFLAMSQAGKQTFLPAIDPRVTYLINDAGDRTDNPCLYYGNAVFELVDRSCGRLTGEFGQLIREIGSLLSVMIEQETAYAFIWYIDKKTYGVSGDADRLWCILRRLATHALSERGWPQGTPETPFSETGHTGMWQPHGQQ